MKKFFLYYNGGSCNQGDHSNGFDQFDTYEEAMAHVAELKDVYELEWKIIEGRLICGGQYH